MTVDVILESDDAKKLQTVFGFFPSAKTLHHNHPNDGPHHRSERRKNSNLNAGDIQISRHNKSESSFTLPGKNACGESSEISGIPEPENPPAKPGNGTGSEIRARTFFRRLENRLAEKRREKRKRRRGSSFFSLEGISLPQVAKLVKSQQRQS